MIRAWLWAALAASALLLTTERDAFACSCLPATREAGLQALAEADLVFEGRALATRPVSPDQAETKFEVLSTYKGEPRRRVALRHANSSAACGFDSFDPAVVYRLFATREGGVWQGPNLCTFDAVTPEVWSEFTGQAGADGSSGAE